MTEHKNYNDENILDNRLHGENEIILYQPDSTIKLKDLGKKLFAFSRMEVLKASELIERLDMKL